MKKTIFILTALLSGCTLNSNVNNGSQSNSAQQINQPENQIQLNAPETLKYAGKQYKLQANHDLGTIARIVYFSGKESPANWKSEVELLHDRNAEHRTLADRIALRERVYQNTGIAHFQLTEKNSALYSFVIYLPTQTQNNWQVNVARGENVAGCGFVQFQFISKVAKTQKLTNMGKVKLVAYLKKYLIDKELARLEKLDWHWQCQSSATENATAQH